MPNDRQAALRQDLVDAQQALSQVLDRLRPGGDWERTSPRNEGWTVRELVTHLTTSEVGFVAALRRISTGQGGVPADFDPDRWNASQLRRRGELPLEQLRPELEAAHQQMLVLLDSLDPSALDQRGHLSTGGEGSAEDNFRLVAEHKRAHTEDIWAAMAADAATPER